MKARLRNNADRSGDNAAVFKKAEDLYKDGQYLEAERLYKKMIPDPNAAHFCYYRLAQMENMKSNPLVSYELYYKAFTTKPDLCKVMHPNDHPHHNYVFSGKRDEKEILNCPLCGREGTPYWCYPLPEAITYQPANFNPVRIWMRCDACNHLFAREFPERLFIYDDEPRKAYPAYFSSYSDILNDLQKYTSGKRLLEVGIGACECALVAREMGFDVFGLDVIERHVKDAKQKYGLQAEACDFNEFETDDIWDIIIMGDVIEHVLNPEAALKKAYNLLDDKGVLWISTPNFESAYTIVLGHGDPMRRETFHINYFSRDSLYLSLDKCGFKPMSYKVSTHYRGSMEIIAVKK